MSVDFDLFHEWAVDHFGAENIRIRNTAHGVEICTHSPWSEAKIGKVDVKHKLWMSPSGGVSKHPELGSYRCWLTDTMGSLVSLVSQFDHIDFEEAESRICGSSSLRSLEQKVHDFFGHKEEVFEPIIQVPKPEIQLPPSSFLIDKMMDSHWMKAKAKEYLASRKIPTDGLYVCVAGEYKNRIVIPYYDEDGKLIYSNARLMSDKKDALRYRKYPENVRQDEILYMTEWPKPGTKVYIMEGEFDAISLKICGLVACACGGKFMSESQIQMIRQYEPVLAFDADGAGAGAMVSIGNALLQDGFPRVGYVRPPEFYKDWNKLLVKRDADIVRQYLTRFERPYTPDTAAILLSNRI